MRYRRVQLGMGIAALGWAVGCAETTDTPRAGTSGSSAGAETTGAAGSAGTETSGTGGAGGSRGIIVPAQDGSTPGYREGGVGKLPPDFTPTDVGGFKLGKPIGNVVDGGAAQPGPDGCGGIILGVLRDFRPWQAMGGHPDFQVFWGEDATTGLVANDLGADKKPVYASKCEKETVSFATAACPYGPETTTKANFDQWYRNTDNVNQPYLVYFFLAPNGRVFTFHDSLFFPLDGAGYGNSGVGKDNQMHNFHFTTEVHTAFKYAGGETFSFTGDDDLWVFINNKLAIDLGGLHHELTHSVELDIDAAKLGITKGNVYSIDLFHAERRTDESNFSIDTNLDFVDCGMLPPEIK